MSTIGSRIREKRLELGLTVDELAVRLGKNRATVYRYESNDIENFPISVIGPLAEALHTTPAYLMGWSDDPFSYREEPAPDSEGGTVATFGTKLKAARFFRNMSQEHLACLAGTTPRVISHYENDLRTPKIDFAQKLADVLDVPILYLSDNSIPVSALDSMCKEAAAPTPEDGLSPLDVQIMELLQQVSDDHKEMILAQLLTVVKRK